MTKNNDDDLFYQLFCGEYVSVRTKIPISVTEQKGEDLMTMNTQLEFEGYLIEMNPIYLFLGPAPTDISTAVKRKDVVAISIFETKSIYDDILDAMGEPTKKDIN